MTAEKPIDQSAARSPEAKRLREEKRKEVVREMEALMELQQRAEKFVQEANRMILDMESDLPHWSKHRVQIHQALQDAVYVLNKAPACREFYPNGFDEAIDAKIKRETVKNPWD